VKAPILEMSFAGGIDQSQRAELMDPQASFVLLENVRANTRGAVEKRYGFDALTGTSRIGASTRSSGYRMFAYGKQTCVIDRERLDAYSKETNEQVSVGLVPECSMSTAQIPAAASATAGGRVRSACIVNDYLVAAYYFSDGVVYATVSEAETGMVILGPTAVHTTGGSVATVTVTRANNHAVLLICEGSGLPDVLGAFLDCTSATTVASGWGASSVLFSDAASPSKFDAATMGTHTVVAYANDTGGTDRVSVRRINSASTSAATTVNTSSTTVDAVGISANADGTDEVWIGWNESTAVKVIGLSPTTLATTATAATVITTTSVGPSDIAIGMGITTGTGRLFCNGGTSDRTHTRPFNVSAGAVTAISGTTTAFGVIFVSKPALVGSRYYALCSNADGDNVVLCDLIGGNAWLRPVASVAPGIALSPSQHTINPIMRTTREVWWPVAMEIASGTATAQVVKFDFDADHRWLVTEHAGAAYLTGGIVSFYDGSRLCESGFVVRPPTPTAADSTGGSGPNGVYRYAYVYEHVDGTGRRHISSVSDPSAEVTVVDNTITVTVYNLGISSRISRATDPMVRISLYRTLAGGEPPYYFVTSLSNTLTSSIQTYADSTTDATLQTQAQLFAPNLPGVDGGPQDRRPPPGMEHLVSFNGFLVGASGETIYWSGQDIGGEGTWWSPLFQQPVSGGGDITALTCQDGTLYAFKADRIFAMAGQPPTDNGADGGLGAPSRLAVDFGARSPFTCVTSLGIFFVSERGIEILNRARQVEFIGERVQDTFAEFPHVTAMTYDPDSSCVYVECAATFTNGIPVGSGRTLVFDTRARVWRSIDQRIAPAADGCLVWNGSDYRYGWLRAEGETYIETSAHHLDPGDVRVRMYAKTSDIHVAGIHGEQNIEGMILLGSHEEDHDLEIGVAHDYSDTFVSETRDSDALAAMAIYNPHFDIAQQTGQSVQVEIEDAAPTGTANVDTTGNAAKWVALTFIGGGKAGVKRTSSVLRGGA
jgi:hypothetical protein